MIVEPLSDEKEWEEFVANSSKGTFFHTLKWKRVLENSFPYESLYLVIRDSNEELIGVCPFVITKKLWPFKVLDSLHDSDFGGPLIKEEYKKEAAYLLKDYLKELSSDKGITYARIRFSERELCEYLKTKTSKVDTNSGTMNLDLEEKPADFIWSKVFTKKKNQRWFIRRFERDGFQNREAEGLEDVNKFYTLYYDNMNYIGAQPHPFSFFKNIWNSLYPDNFGIILTEKEEKCIGGESFYIYKERKSIYQTCVGFDRNLGSKYRTYYYLNWGLIKWAEKHGFKYVSFGATPSDPNASHYSYKSNFGAEFNQDYFLYLPFNRKLFLLRENAIKVGRKMKNRLPKTLLMKIASKL
jgi:hypothetical protein